MTSPVSRTSESEERVLCVTCKVTDTGDFIQCNEFDLWTHYKCAKLSEENVERIDEFYCTECQNRNPELINTWYGIELEPLTKHIAGHYVVEAIIDYGFDESGDRSFFVKWKGYPDSENSWVSEYDMERCYDLMMEFMLKHDLVKNKYSLYQVLV